MRKPFFTTLPIVNDLIYRCEDIPFRTVKQIRFSPKDVDIPYQGVYIRTLDGEVLHGW